VVASCIHQPNLANPKMVLSNEPTPETTRNGHECAPYTILESQDGFQVRNYPSRKWATVLHEKKSHDETQNKSFMKLFGYITGTNETGSKMSMTVPVSTKVTTEEQADCVFIKEEMGFYVPTEHQEAAPPPTADQEVKIVTRPEMIAYVREFGGFAKDKDWEEQKERLKKDLEGRDDLNHIDFEIYFRQGFDSPFKSSERKNEVFFTKKSSA